MLELLNWNPTDWICIACLVLLFLIQLYYYLVFFRGIPRHAGRIANGRTGVSDQKPPVSIIITAKDQEENLARHLPLLLEQDYPEFQVVVVNEASADGTEDLLLRLSQQYPHLYATFMPEGVQSLSEKKMALTIGIKAAKYDILLFTEANGSPSGNDWISSMVREMVPGVSVVLGYSTFESKKGLFRKLIAYDNLFESMRFLGMAASRKPYMGLGSNMAYRKELFFQNRGFATHLNLHAGEDDLFISDVARSSNTRIEVSPASKIILNTNHLRSYWKQHKITRMFTSDYYRFSARFRNGFEVFTRMLFYTLSTLLLVIGFVRMDVPMLAVTGGLVLLRLLIQVLVVSQCSRVLNERRFYISVPWYDLFIPVYSFFLCLEKVFHAKSASTRQVLH